MIDEYDLQNERETEEIAAAIKKERDEGEVFRS